MHFHELLWKTIAGGTLAVLGFIGSHLAQATDHVAGFGMVSDLTMNAACIYAVVHMFKMLQATKAEAAKDRENHANERKQDAVNHAIERNAAAAEHSKAMAALQAETIKILREDSDRADASRSSLQTTMEGLRTDIQSAITK